MPKRTREPQALHIQFSHGVHQSWQRLLLDAGEDKVSEARVAVRQGQGCCGCKFGAPGGNDPALPIALSGGRTSLQPPVVAWDSATDAELVASGTVLLAGYSVPLGRPVGPSARFVVFSPSAALPLLGVRLYAPPLCEPCDHHAGAP